MSLKDSKQKEMYMSTHAYTHIHRKWHCVQKGIRHKGIEVYNYLKYYFTDFLGLL